MYLSDHGDYFCDYGVMRKGVGMPEDLTHIPMVWAGPGITAQRKINDALVSSADVMPTICEALGVAIPHGAQGRSLWPMLRGQAYPEQEFRSVYSEVGFGGMYYDEEDHIPYSIAHTHPPGSIKSGFDTLNAVTQSGNLKMVRMGQWKLLFDMMGNAELYNLSSDPYELTNLFGNPSFSAERDKLLQELLAWTIRTQDDLPTAAYKTKWPNRNWYAPYRKGGPPA